MSKLCSKCQYLVWAPLLSSTALIPLGMAFTRAAQVVAGILFHSSIMTSRSCWMLDTWHFTIRLSMPRGLNFFDWPLRDLFQVESVLENICKSLACAVSFRVLPVNFVESNNSQVFLLCGAMLNISGQYERIALKTQIWTALLQDAQICMVLSSRQKTWTWWMGHVALHG